MLPAACQGTWLDTDGGIHKKGERLATARAFYAEPIQGKALAWHGLGTVPNYGLSANNNWFLEDRLAVGMGLRAIEFQPPGRHVFGAEFEGRLRYYFAESDTVGFFFDLTGGYAVAEAQMPPGGTRGNYTFAAGPGLEVPLSHNRSFLMGVDFHHMSNALGRDNPRNPSQNETLIWVGYGVKW